MSSVLALPDLLMPNMSCAALLLLLAIIGGARAEGNVYVADADRFPGWKGELPIPSKDRPMAGGKNASTLPGLAVSFGEPNKVWLDVTPDSPSL